MSTKYIIVDCHPLSVNSKGFKLNSYEKVSLHMYLCELE